MLIGNNPPPNWASWLENWCGNWQLTNATTETKETKAIEVGMLVVKFPDGTLHPGVVVPSAGVMQAGGFSFRAIDQNSKRCLEVLQAAVQGDDVPQHIEIPTEGEVYEEEDEIP